MCDVLWLMDQVMIEGFRLLHEYVEREEAAMLGGADVESIYSSRYTTHPLLIGAPLEQLKICHSSKMTDATIEVLCQQLAGSLRSLTLCGCTRVSRTGFNKAIAEDIDVHCIRWLLTSSVYFFLFCFVLKE